MKKTKKYSASKANNNSRKKMMLALIGVLLIGSVGGVLAYNKYANNDSAQPTSADGSGINYSPPTKEDQKANDVYKNTLGNQQDNQSSGNTNAKKSVKPVILSSGQTDTAVKVSGHVPGVLEDNGTCILTMTKGSAKVTGSRAATPNVSEMSCGFISIERSKLSVGNWTATITYKSKTAGGTSTPQTVKVE